MKNIMKQAVDTVYKSLWPKQNDPEKYGVTLVRESIHAVLG